MIRRQGGVNPPPTVSSGGGRAQDEPIKEKAKVSYAAQGCTIYGDRRYPARTQRKAGESRRWWGLWGGPRVGGRGVESAYGDSGDK